MPPRIAQVDAISERRTTDLENGIKRSKLGCGYEAMNKATFGP
jgi:hypothetical protein